MVSGAYCEGLFPDTVCWTRLRNTWIAILQRFISRIACSCHVTLVATNSSEMSHHVTVILPVIPPQMIIQRFFSNLYINSRKSPSCNCSCKNLDIHSPPPPKKKVPVIISSRMVDGKLVFSKLTWDRFKTFHTTNMPSNVAAGVAQSAPEAKGQLKRRTPRPKFTSTQIAKQGLKQGWLTSPWPGLL